MIGLLLGASLTVISAAPASPSPPSWSCAYVAERLPRVLAAMGEDTVSAEETRAARKRLGLAEAVLTRASNLALARTLGANRLVTVRCTDAGRNTTLEAQTFETARPGAGPSLRIERLIAELPEAVEELARGLGGSPPASPELLGRSSAHALLKAGPSLANPNAAERARGLNLVLDQDPSSLDLRLSTIESLLAVRDFDRAIAIAAAAPPGGPLRLKRAVQFQAGAALLEAGRYAEARDTFEALGRARETAASLNHMGVALFRLRDKDASRSFERASFFPDQRQADIFFNRSLSLIFEGRPEIALPFIDTVRAKTPEDARARLLKVWALKLLGREPERMREWEDLMAIAPSFAALGVPDLARRLERIFVSERRADRP